MHLILFNIILFSVLSLFAFCLVAVIFFWDDMNRWLERRQEQQEATEYEITKQNQTPTLKQASRRQTSYTTQRFKKK